MKKNIGCNCPTIGTFKPNVGDFGLDLDNCHWVWDGQHWYSEDGRKEKSLEQWLGFEQAIGLGYVKVIEEKS